MILNPLLEEERSADLWHVDENDEEPDVGEDGEQSGHAEHGKVLDSKVKNEGTLTCLSKTLSDIHMYSYLFIYTLIY